MRIIAGPAQLTTANFTSYIETASIASASYAGDNTYAAAAVLLLYDHALTISQEVDLVWKRRWTGVSVLFVLNRVLSISFSLSMMLFLTDWSAPSSCKAVGIFYMIPELLLVLMWASFSALRVYALSGRARAVAIPIFIWSCVPFGVLLYDNASVTFFEVTLSSSMKLCVQVSSQALGVPKPLAIATSISQVLTDIAVLGITWWNTFRIKKAAAAMQMETPLITLMLRDGTIYFLALLVLNAVLMVTYTLSNAYTNLTYLLYACICIIVSRFLLNIRQVSNGTCIDGENSTFVTTRMSTIDFRSSMVRDMGAQITYSFASQTPSESAGEDDFVSERSSDDPMYVEEMPEDSLAAHKRC